MARDRTAWKCGAGGAGRTRLPREAGLAPREPSSSPPSSPASRMAPRALFRTPSRTARGKASINAVQTADVALDEALLRRAEAILEDHARSRTVGVGRGDEEKEMEDNSSRNRGALHAGKRHTERALLCRMLHSWSWHVREKSRAARHEERVLAEARGVLDAVGLSAQNERMRLAEEMKVKAQLDAADWQADASRRAAAFRQRCLGKVILTSLLTSALFSREFVNRAAEFRAQRAHRRVWRWWIKALAEFRAASEAQARVSERKAKLEALVKGFSTSARHKASAPPAMAKVAERSNCSMQAGAAAGRIGLPKANLLQFSGPATAKPSGEALRPGAMVCSGTQGDRRGALWCQEEVKVVAQENPNANVGGLGTKVRREGEVMPGCGASSENSVDVEARGNNAGETRALALGGLETQGIKGLKDQPQTQPQHAPGNIQPWAEHASVAAMRQREVSRKAARMALKVS